MMVKGNKDRIHPQVFALYLAMASMVMMFIALTSAYLVRQAAGNWLVFPIPKHFYISTILIIFSSIFLQFSYNKYKKQDSPKFYRGMLVFSLLLGIGFLFFQYMGWQQLVQWGIMFTGNPAGSFVYVISGLHALHVIGGIGALCVAVYHAYSLKFEWKAYRKRRFNLTTQYWHFVGVLWIYLLFFLIIQR